MEEALRAQVLAKSARGWRVSANWVRKRAREMADGDPAGRHGATLSSFMEGSWRARQKMIGDSSADEGLL